MQLVFLAQLISAQMQVQLQFEANTEFTSLTGLSRSSCASCSLSPSSCTRGPASTCCCCCCCWRREDGDAAVLLLLPLPLPLALLAATKAVGDAPPGTDVATDLVVRGESPVGLVVLVTVVLAVVLLLLLLVVLVLAAAARCDCTAALRGDSVTAKLFSSCWIVCKAAHTADSSCVSNNCQSIMKAASVVSLL
jgi:hypothetical protein